MCYTTSHTAGKREVFLPTGLFFFGFGCGLSAVFIKKSIWVSLRRRRCKCFVMQGEACARTSLLPCALLTRTENKFKTNLSFLCFKRIKGVEPALAEQLKIIPLGGLNEIGKNMTVYEYGGEIIVVDCGMARRCFSGRSC